MVWQRGLLAVWLACLGCQTFRPCLEQPDNGSASRHWEMGQMAMRQGRADEAIRCYEQSLAIDPEFSRNHLSLAAAYLTENNPNSACTHLARYVESNPDQLGIRAGYAELLLRQSRLAEARVQFEQLVSQAQSDRSPDRPDLIHCHSRLMEIATEADDSYHEHLHRGIGLFLLARKRATLPDSEEDLPPESLLCKAAAELTLAQLGRPDEARPCWYLYQVWSRLGQRQPALCRLRQANAAAPFTFLTPAELCALNLAVERYQAEVERK